MVLGELLFVPEKEVPPSPPVGGFGRASEPPSVPQRGVEPLRLIQAQDPKSCVSANFTTAASCY